MTASKLRIKRGSVEIEFEGTEEFIAGQLPKVLEAVEGLVAEPESTLPVGAGNGPAANGSMTKAGAATLSTNTIAHKLKVSSGSTLARAAAARLSVVEGKDTFHKKEILSEMRSATSFYKESFARNMGGYLKTLLNDGDLLLNAQGIYSLPANKKAELEAQLAHTQ